MPEEALTRGLVSRSFNKVELGSNFGTLFRLSTWGESHGGGVGVVVDGCPPKIPLRVEDIQIDLDRRRPGQSENHNTAKRSRSSRNPFRHFRGADPWDTDSEFSSGTRMLVPKAYSEMSEKFRPSHADYTYQAKYGIRNWQGRRVAPALAKRSVRVAAAAIAKKVIQDTASLPI